MEGRQLAVYSLVRTRGEFILSRFLMCCAKSRTKDLGYAFASGRNWISTQPFMITAFDQRVAALYSAGGSSIFPFVFPRLTKSGIAARNFLILSIPPVNRTPLATSFGAAAQATLKTAADFWNGRLIVYGGLLPTLYPRSNAVYFDTQPLFNTVRRLLFHSRILADERICRS